MLTIITLPEGFVGDITDNIGTILSDLSGYLTLIIGVVLGAVVIEIIIGAIRK